MDEVNDEFYIDFTEICDGNHLLACFHYHIRDIQNGEKHLLNKVEFDLLHEDITVDNEEIQLLVSEICTYSNENPVLDIFEIGYGDDSALILEVLQTIRRSSSIQNYILGQVELSCIQYAKFLNYTVDTASESEAISPWNLNRSIDLSRIEIKPEDDNKAVLLSAIENCSFFTSWKIYGMHALFCINALKNNRYMKSLHIPAQCHNFGEDAMNGLTSLILSTKTLTKLRLELSPEELSSVPIVTSLAEALIQSESVTDLTLRQMKFENKATQEAFTEVFKRKSNIQSLQIDLELFLLNDKYEFEASLFSNLLLKYNLCNLTIGFPLDQRCDCLDVDHEIPTLFSLLKDSCLESLYIYTYCNIQIIDDEQKMLLAERLFYKRLFGDVIPFMKNLKYFEIDFKHKVSTRHERMYANSIRRCNPQLLETNAKEEYEYDRYHLIYFSSVQKYMKRNKKLLDIIRNLKDWSKAALPRTFLVAKVTGPDMIFRSLCSLDILIGPDLKSSNIV